MYILVALLVSSANRRGALVAAQHFQKLLDRGRAGYGNKVEVHSCSTEFFSSNCGAGPQKEASSTTSEVTCLLHRIAFGLGQQLQQRPQRHTYRRHHALRQLVVLVAPAHLHLQRQRLELR